MVDMILAVGSQIAGLPPSTLAVVLGTKLMAEWVVEFTTVPTHQLSRSHV
jgi:hypothetical protein